MKVLLALLLTGTAWAKSYFPRSVLEAIPSKYDIEAPEHSGAKAELKELLEACGPGVIQGARSRDGKKLRNKCTFEVALDDLFFQKEKTGFIEKPEQFYQDGVTFVEASPKEALLDSFDIRDLMKNGLPDLRKQLCSDCWAWATHHGLELARAVHEQKVYDHSVQAVISCSHEGSCRSGGSMDAVDFLKHGLPYESEYPYKANDSACKYSNSQINTGWDGKTIATPYIGNSLMYSLYNRKRGGSFREGPKVQNIMAAMQQWKGPVVVTVEAYSVSGSGIYNNCSAINSGGNHMVNIVGWEMVNGKRVAHVWNSWGKSHGVDGVSRINWECGDGRLNRGLGRYAKIVQYKSACSPPDAAQTYLHETIAGQTVQIGKEQNPGTTCTWLPKEGLSDPNSCVTQAKPNQSTEYHLTASNACGTSSSMTLVYLWGQNRKAKDIRIKTPFGETPYLLEK